MYRYIKPSRTVSKTAMVQKMEQLTKQSDTDILLDRNGKTYKFKFTVEQFATLHLCYESFNKAKNSAQWQRYFTEV